LKYFPSAHKNRHDSSCNSQGKKEGGVFPERSLLARELEHVIDKVDMRSKHALATEAIEIKTLEDLFWGNLLLPELLVFFPLVCDERAARETSDRDKHDASIGFRDLDR
jgi:hypothetical protein